MTSLRHLFRPAPVRAASPPQLHVIVDTEEEFDWSAPFSRDSVGVTAIAEVWRLQDVLRPYALKPTYVIDYPVAATASSAATLGSFARTGECEIGAHLHPWVNPPYVETLGNQNSYACNLGADVEREKLLNLKTAIETNLGVTPRVYKAGRYGFGPTTADALEQLGFDVDISLNPHMDYSTDGGPVFDGFEPVPLLFGRRRTLLELPCTTGFVGVARRYGEALHRAASSPLCQRFKAVGILARSGMLNKIMLSPEGSTYEEMVSLTDTLFADGVRSFAFTFHSPSLKPGCTRYVSTEQERDRFLDTIGRYCDYFMNRLGGVASTPASLFDDWRRDNAA